MCQRYGAHMPFSELAVHLGLKEDEPSATDGADLVWLGRIDGQKAPHIAVVAAGLLRRRIRLVGPVFDRTYLDRHRQLLQAPHVELVGELSGPAKVAALHGGSALVHTCARDYIEAGAAVFGEALRVGTPVAALAWRPGTCADAALCPETGRVATVGPASSDDQAGEALAAAIEATGDLEATTVQELPAALRHALHDRWEFARDGERLQIQHCDRGTPYRPPRRVPHWADLLDRLESAFEEHGVPRAPHLPLVDPDVLDALRTTVLLIGSGIAPAARGPGSAVRRLLRLIPRDIAPLGLSTAVREFHGYWALTTTDLAPWAEVACRMERFKSASDAATPKRFAGQGASRSSFQVASARR